MKNPKTLSLLSAVSLAAVLSTNVSAQPTVDRKTVDGTKAAQAAAASDMTDGEVRKVDKESGKLTLKHAEIKNLEMPAMTMVFAVKDKTMLDKLQPGVKVRFKATNDGGKFTVTEIEVSK